MKVVMVYESMFGNTEALVAEVARGVARTGAQVVVTEVGDAAATDLVGCSLLVVAAPTHALSLSRRSSRKEAADRGASPHRQSTGLREWLATIDDLLAADSVPPVVAVLDTRLRSVRHWPGSAAGRAARMIRSHGLTVVARTSFYVESMTGPLVDGELARAGTWGRDLVDRVGLAAGHVAT